MRDEKLGENFTVNLQGHQVLPISHSLSSYSKLVFDADVAVVEAEILEDFNAEG